MSDVRLLQHPRVCALELRKNIQSRSRDRSEFDMTRFALRLACEPRGARTVWVRLFHNMHANPHRPRRFGSEAMLVEHDVGVIVGNGGVRGVVQLWRATEKVSPHLAHYVRADGTPCLHRSHVLTRKERDESVSIPGHGEEENGGWY